MTRCPIVRRRTLRDAEATLLEIRSKPYRTDEYVAAEEVE